MSSNPEESQRKEGGEGIDQKVQDEREAGPGQSSDKEEDGDAAAATAADGHESGDETRQDGEQHKKDPIPDKDKIHKKKDKKPSGGIDSTPLPDAPPGYTVKFIFHKATNLPPADVSTVSADPFLIATLKTSAPKRHKQDPDPTHRTKTLRKTTDPEWEAEWILANVPASGFVLKCRVLDEDYPDHNDRLGDVTIKVPQIGANWKGFPPPGRAFSIKKRTGSKRAYGVKALASMLHPNVHMTATLYVSIQVLGKSDPPHAQLYTVAPSVWVKHFSAMIGRIAGTTVHKDENKDRQDNQGDDEKKTKKHDFQANEMQLCGPVPPSLYHRYVSFKPVIKGIFSYHGFRGKILNKALHSQHAKIYNYDRSTERGHFQPCSEDASLAFLRLAHFDEGARVFTYVLTLDALLRFTETGEEFGIDLLSKHTMHSGVETYVACSGEFFVRRLEKPDASNDPEPDEATHPTADIPGGPPDEAPPPDPQYYQLIIDNDSGTYRPDKAILPDLKSFLEKNFPGLGIVALHWEDEELKKLKAAQQSAKKKEGRKIPMVLRSVSSSSLSSNESRLDSLERTTEGGGGGGGPGTRLKMTKENAFDLVEDPSKLKGLVPHKEMSGGESKSVTNGEHANTS